MNVVLFKLATIILVAAITATSAHAAIGVNKSFFPLTVYPGESSKLTIAISNSDSSPGQNATFTDVFPDGMFAASVPNITTTCGGTVTTSNQSNAGSVTLTGGVVPKSNGNNAGTCTITVNVNSPTAGNRINRIEVNTVSASVNGSTVNNINTGVATLAVVLTDVSSSLSQTPFRHLQGYQSSTHSITLTNPNPIDLTGASFYYNLSSDADTVIRYTNNFKVHFDNSASSTCGGTVSANAGTNTILLSGATIPANSSCTVTYKVEPDVDEHEPYRYTYADHIFKKSLLVTDQGATNSRSPHVRRITYRGIEIKKTFDGAAAVVLNTNTSQTSNLKIEIKNANSQAISNFDFEDVMPTGLTVEPGSVVSTCGGTTSSNIVKITGAILPAAPTTSNSGQFGSCIITARVRPISDGSYENIIPAGDLNGYKYSRAKATLNVVSGELTISKELSIGTARNWFLGDSISANFKFKNETSSPIFQIRLPDDLATMGNGIKVEKLGANTCSSTPTLTTSPRTDPNSDSFILRVPSLGANESCIIQVILRAAPNAHATYSQIRTNTIPSGSILFNTQSQTDVPFALTLSAVSPRLYRSLEVRKSYIPQAVGSNGITRLRLTVKRYSTARLPTASVALTDSLPAGQTVANKPNITNGCGGTLTAVPGSTQVSLSGGTIIFGPGSRTEASCYFELDVRTSGIPQGSTSHIDTNAIQRGSVTGVDTSPTVLSTLKTGYRTHTNYNNTSASVTQKASQITVNKGFSPVSIKGGGASRVRIEFTNGDANAVDLTGVGITDVFTSNLLTLFANVDATFTDLAGVPNNNGCRGGKFSGSSGERSISLSDAQIDAGRSCVFSFNVTALEGGNHLNIISPGAISSDQGVSNKVIAHAALQVDRQVGIGKGFHPDIIEAGGRSRLTLTIYNTNDHGYNSVGFSSRVEGSPAIKDILPSGVTIADPNSGTTTCAGGTVSAGSNYVQLDGGLFAAGKSCTVSIDVTSNTNGLYLNTIGIDELQARNPDNSVSRNADTAEASLRVISSPTITKSFAPSVINVGEVTRVTFTIENSNPAVNLPTGFTGVSFTDTLVNMRVAAPFYVGGTCGAFKSNASVGSADLKFSSISIPPNSSCTISVDVTSDKAGVHPNITSGVSAHQTTQPGPASNTANLRVKGPLISLEMTGSLDLGQDNTASVGDIVTYSFKVTNTGDVPLSNIRLSDDLLKGILFKGGPISLAPGASDTTSFSGTYALTQADIDAGKLSNQARVTGQDSSNNTVTDTSDDPTTTNAAKDATVLRLIASPSLVLEKTASLDLGQDKVASVGDVVTYSFKVTNNGNVPLTNIRVADDVLQGIALKGGPINLAPGASDTTSFTATYALTQAQIDAGKLSNQATVTGLNPSNGTVTDISDDPTTANVDNDPTILQINRIYSFTVTKTANTSRIDRPGRVNYLIKLANTGNSTLTNIRLDDIISVNGRKLNDLSLVRSAGDANGDDKLDITEEWIYEASFEIDNQLLVGGGILTNRVDVHVAELPDAQTDNATTELILPVGTVEFQLIKTADTSIVFAGDVVGYTITATNIDQYRTGIAVIRDIMPEELVYKTGSLTVDGKPYDPMRSGGSLSIGPFEVPAGNSAVIKLDLIVPASVSPGDYTNTAQVFHPTTGLAMSADAAATIRVAAEAVFDCGTVIGKVFNDQNQNGYQDQGEVGISSAKVVTINGEIITADAHGRFSVPCQVLPQEIGANFLLKLDERSLPMGYRMTTENPRVVRLTAGKMVELNFGVAITQIMRIDLSDGAFVANDGAIALRPELRHGIAQLLRRIKETPSVIRMVYFAEGESQSLIRRRLNAVKAEISNQWRMFGNYKLEVETLVQNQAARGFVTQ